MRSSPFGIVPARAVDDTRMTLSALRILVALSTYADQDRQCHPGTRTLAARLGVSQRHVITEIRRLEEWGYVATVARFQPNGGQRSNSYTLVHDADLPPEHRRGGGEPRQEGGETPAQEGGEAGLHPNEQTIGTDQENRDLPPKGSLIDSPASEIIPANGKERGGDLVEEAFDRFWSLYPRGRKGSRVQCLQKFRSALKKVKGDPWPILEGAGRYAEACAACARSAGTETYEFVMGPQVWLNNRRWEAEDLPRPHAPSMRNPRSRYDGLVS